MFRFRVLFILYFSLLHFIFYRLQSHLTMFISLLETLRKGEGKGLRQNNLHNTQTFVIIYQKLKNE